MSAPVSGRFQSMRLVVVPDTITSTGAHGSRLPWGRLALTELCMRLSGALSNFPHAISFPTHSFELCT